MSIAACVALACQTCVLAQVGNSTYLDVPRVTATDPSHFRDLFTASSGRVVRIAMFGDSQETSPWGWGRHYVPFLNARLSRVFGPCSETMLLSCINMVERPQWLATVAMAPAAVSPGLPVSQLLPCVGSQHLDDSSGEFRAVLLHDSTRTADPSLDGGTWMAPGPYFADLLAVSGGASLTWSNEPTDGSDPAASPALQRGTIEVGTGLPAQTLAWSTIGPLSFGGMRHLQLSIGAAGAGTDFIGVRFHAAGPGRGVVLQSFARGGMRLPDLMADHPAAGSLLRAVAPDLTMLHYGANDAMQMSDIESWRSQLVETIRWLRAASGNPSLPVIIVSDLRGGTAGMPFQMIDRMPVVAHQIATVDPNVMAVNLRRITEEEYGWGQSTFYLADTAHFHPYAQRLEAEALCGEVCRFLAIPDAACGAAVWSDCVRTLGATCAQGGCRPIMDVEASGFGIPWAGAGSSCIDADQDGYPDLCPPAGPADLNGDSWVNGADLALMLSVWGHNEPTPADLNGDGRVDGQDLALLLAVWS